MLTLHGVVVGVVAVDIFSIQVIVSCRPFSSEYFGSHPESSFARLLSLKSSITSLFSGLTRDGSFSTGVFSLFIRFLILSITDPTECVSPVPKFIVSPTVFSARPTVMKPSAVSFTKVRSLVGSSEPALIVSEVSAWLITAGMKARALWRGP